MKRLIVSVAGLGWSELERRGKTRLAGLEFSAVRSVFPAVTCTAQATLRTGLLPQEHGMICNGIYSRSLQKPSFWEQSAALVSGARIWETRRAQNETAGMFFFQQSLGENLDYILSPAPIHKHGGGMVMACYGQPVGLEELLEKNCGSFPLWRYWGPFASARVGDGILDRFERIANRYDPDIAFLYLPTLDYEAQRRGPEHPDSDAAFARFTRELERLAKIAEAKGAALSVLGEYDIHAVAQGPVFPNRTLRRMGLFTTRSVRGRAYPDFFTSKAFAMVDHEIAHVYVREEEDIEFVREILLGTGDYESAERRSDGGEWAHPNAGELLLTAKPGAWCAYPWWTNPREAPDYATHIDIHNKPGYDPSELFLQRIHAPQYGLSLHPQTCQDHFRIRGSHGRRGSVAVAGLPKSVETYVEAANILL